jgi:hypothetical protein
MHQSDEKTNKRGPYKSQTVLREEDRRQAEMLADPDVVAFAEAIAKITDPKTRAHIAWLVEDLSRHRPPRR